MKQFCVFRGWSRWSVCQLQCCRAVSRVDSKASSHAKQPPPQKKDISHADFQPWPKIAWIKIFAFGFSQPPRASRLQAFSWKESGAVFSSRGESNFHWKVKCETEVRPPKTTALASSTAWLLAFDRRFWAAFWPRVRVPRMPGISCRRRPQEKCRSAVTVQQMVASSPLGFFFFGAAGERPDLKTLSIQGNREEPRSHPLFLTLLPHYYGNESLIVVGQEESCHVLGDRLNGWCLDCGGAVPFFCCFPSPSERVLSLFRQRIKNVNIASLASVRKLNRAIF